MAGILLYVCPSREFHVAKLKHSCFTVFIGLGSLIQDCNCITNLFNNKVSPARRMLAVGFLPLDTLQNEQIMFKWYFV